MKRDCGCNHAEGGAEREGKSMTKRGGKKNRMKERTKEEEN